MVTELRPPLKPRNGHTLEVVLACRVSDPGPGKQDIMSLADQEALYRRWLSEHTELPLNIQVLAGSGSGECLDRKEYLQLMEMVESDRYDLVLSEDLGRIVRRVYAHIFCEHCVDHHTRLIALNDHVDTCESGWEDRSLISAWHHERSNRDTSDRIKRSHRNHFEQGRCLSLPIFGYRKKPGGKTEDDLEKIPEAIPVYKEWFRRLDEGRSYSEIADWLNESGVSPGPYSRSSIWNCQAVTRTSHNILLKGYRYRNKRKTRRINNPGHYKSEKADPKDLLIRQVPHLAFFDEAYYDRVITKTDARNAKFRRNGKDGPDPCQNRPKKRTRFPGQTVYCGICGRLYVFGGHGQRDHLMCEGARGYKCWNGITVDGVLATESTSAVVFDGIEAIESFDLVFLDKINKAARAKDAAHTVRLEAIDRDLRSVQREIENVMHFIRGGNGERVRAELSRLEEREKQIRRERDGIVRAPTDTIVIPSAEEVKSVTRKSFQHLALNSFEFAKQMRALTGKIYVYPFCCCGGTSYVLRAKFQLRLAGLLPDRRVRDALHGILTREIKIDLFKQPQHVEFRERVVAGRQQCDVNGHKRTEREVAESLGITVTAAQRAAALNRLMLQQSLTDPYVLQLEPPDNHPKLRRHLHPRYRFEPLPGHRPDW